MSKDLLIKQKEAKERQDQRNKRSHKDQIARLDAKFGKDLGAKKEREKIKNLIENQNKPKETKEHKEEKEEKKSKKKKKKQ